MACVRHRGGLLCRLRPVALLQGDRVDSGLLPPRPRARPGPRPRPARRRVSRPTTSRGFRVPSERNTRRGAPARPPPPPRPRRPLRLPPPRRDRTSSPRARTPGRAPLALARDFRGAIRAFRVESFSQARSNKTSRKKSAAHPTDRDGPSTAFDRYFFSELPFAFKGKKTHKEKIHFVCTPVRHFCTIDRWRSARLIFSRFLNPLSRRVYI